MRDRFPWIALAGGLAFAGAVTVAAFALQSRDDGPVTPVWDRDACAHCHMHVGEPAFAAQSHTRDGRVHHYDDPGCLFLDLARLEGQVESTWFHHHREDRWIAGTAVGFVEATPTPMGYGLGAVEATTPGALSFDDAHERVEPPGAKRP